MVVLDLLRHDFESARELYADVWLGFSQVDILELLEGAGFRNVSVSVVDREAEPPHFETLMAIGVKNA
jgi:ArsR family transcriptional regulator